MIVFVMDTASYIPIGVANVEEVQVCLDKGDGLIVILERIEGHTYLRIFSGRLKIDIENSSLVSGVVRSNYLISEHALGNIFGRYQLDRLQEICNRCLPKSGEGITLYVSDYSWLNYSLKHVLESFGMLREFSEEIIEYVFFEMGLTDHEGVPI